ncbi:hypothetical protein VitviT2T_020492 [Vitis vinifera]|uniref:Uncharacterized protein n=1 Tax=Vitis vinifera TaxID=29760 RepID=A0ABY9D433_VITVI|nr:hypothetical protein VitviT2T_020492 [Vitis vinifera]
MVTTPNAHLSLVMLEFQLLLRTQLLKDCSFTSQQGHEPYGCYRHWMDFSLLLPLSCMALRWKLDELFFGLLSVVTASVTCNE